MTTSPSWLAAVITATDAGVDQQCRLCPWRIIESVWRRPLEAVLAHIVSAHQDIWQRVMVPGNAPWWEWQALDHEPWHPFRRYRLLLSVPDATDVNSETTSLQDWTVAVDRLMASVAEAHKTFPGDAHEPDSDRPGPMTQDRRAT